MKQPAVFPFLSLGLAAVSIAHAAPPQPLWKSPVIKATDPAHSVEVDVALDPAQKTIYLVAGDAGDSFTADWAEWIEPRFVGDYGEKKLTSLKWTEATVGWGEPHIDRNPSGRSMVVDGKPQPGGIGAHANSMLAYAVPPGTTRFKARVAIDDGGTGQGPSSSVQFFVYQTKPPAIAAAKNGGGGGGGREPDDELASLTVADGLEATLFAAEPLLLSPSAIDVDPQGRVWVAEIVNYRGHNGKRPEGDRILILQDTDGDGKADKQTVFYQGRDIDSPHGVCALGNRCIVSANGKVFVLTDDNGDDKADRAEVLFSGISGAQHDHGVHKFMFGPDGRLYFNLGNAGLQLRDKDGKPIVDLDGKEVAPHRKPYQEGLVLRCNLDGSQVETLAWDFRNNWMVTADSFGTLWQSDNDDDGNRGVRINYVMEGGNYGYRDEVTGAGWQEPRSNWESEIPLRHWHQNDPGVVPNLLQTGAGSPTGIMVYEGDLLPAVFRGQMIHCDAGPNVVRSYPVKKQGAGYSAEIVNVLEGTRDRWFRPSDVVAAPDGSLIVADWYDPGVGGHGMGDLQRGRLFRVAPPGSKWSVPKTDLSTPAGAVAAITSPNLSTRYQAFTALQNFGAKAESDLTKLYADANPRFRARALWLLGRLDAAKWVGKALADKDEDIRITGLRLARQSRLDIVPLAGRLAGDPSFQVLREAAIGLRHQSHSDAAKVWAQLAARHTGNDRWYLEALGIGADQQWEACLEAYFSALGGVDKALATPGGRDIVWRSRAKGTADLLAKLMSDKSVPDADKMRYLRAFDFQPAEQRQEALKKVLASW